LTVQSTKDGFGKSPHKVICSDTSGSGKLLGISYFMGKEPWMLKQWASMKNNWYQPGNVIVVSGKLFYSSFTQSFEISNPQKVVSVVGDGNYESAGECRGNGIFSVDPVYPLTEGISAPKLKVFIQHALQCASQDLENLEWMCPTYRKEKGWPTFAEAVRNLHAPQSHNYLLPSSKYKERLAFDELVILQLRQLEKEGTKKMLLEERRSKTWGDVDRNRLDDNYALPGNGILTNALIQDLPFNLTNSQKCAIDNIFEE